MNNNKTVFFAIGILLIILGTFMFVPFLVQFIYDESNSAFLSSGVITIFIGVLLVLTNIEENKRLGLQQTFLLTALSWLSIAIFGCLPFVFSNLNLSFVDAFFESMSGITTTGSTIIRDLDSTPKGILIWRAILQWLGGMLTNWSTISNSIKRYKKLSKDLQKENTGFYAMQICLCRLNRWVGFSRLN